MAAGAIALAIALIQEEEDEYFQLMMEAAVLAANEWMEMEEGLEIGRLGSIVTSLFSFPVAVM